MQEQHPTTQQAALTQPSIVPWSEQDMLRLSQLAPRRTSKNELLAAFPGRTIGAIRVKLVAERRRLGIPKSNGPENLLKRNLETTILDRNDPGLPSDYLIRQRRSAARSNAAFLAALQIAA